MTEFYFSWRYAIEYKYTTMRVVETLGGHLAGVSAVAGNTVTETKMTIVEWFVKYGMNLMFSFCFSLFIAYKFIVLGFSKNKIKQ